MNENFADGFIVVPSASTWGMSDRRAFVGIFGRHLHAKIDITVLPHNLVVLLSRHHDVDRLAQQHPGNAEKADEDKSLLQCSLETVHEFVASLERFGALEQHHIDEHDKNGWSAAR